MFITFEGLDGAGKSTQINRLISRMQVEGLKIVSTREPGGTLIGDKVRSLLLSQDLAICSEAEVFLYAASRAELVRTVIIPAINRGEVVLCDRFVDASLAYQGAGLGIGVQRVFEVNTLATNGLSPDITFLFDLPVSVSKDRILHSRQGEKPDRIEQRNHEYFIRVRDEFLRIAKEEPNRVVILDATLPPDSLEKEIWRVVANKLAIKGVIGSDLQ